MPLALDHLATIRTEIGAALRVRGFRGGSKRPWVRGDDGAGWVAVALLGERSNTSETASARVNGAVWPPGTREHQCERYAEEVAAHPWPGAPVIATAERVVGEPDAYTFVATNAMTSDARAQQVARAQAVAESLVAWADRMLDARASAPLMGDDDAVAALLARHPGSPDLDPRLDRLTARFQRDPRPIELAVVIQRWRAERGLPAVPLPPWSRHASRPHADGRFRSPRDELLAGIGTAVEFRHADGTVRSPDPQDLPDADDIARWREESRLAPLPDGVLTHLPEWLPYAGWLALPPPEPRP